MDEKLIFRKSFFYNQPFSQVGGAAEVAVEHGRPVQVHFAGQGHEPVATGRVNLWRPTAKAILLSSGI